MKDCPCGTGFSYNDCCGPLIRGTIHADTAEDLMRSRFTAFSKGNWYYLKKTQHESNQEEKTNIYSNLQNEDILWTKLEILDVKNGGALDEEGDVSFIAYYAENGEEKKLHEMSKFIKENGRWYYSKIGSKVIPTVSIQNTKPFMRHQPKTGRNELCPCGSGKKYKKCCGK